LSILKILDGIAKILRDLCVSERCVILGYDLTVNNRLRLNETPLNVYVEENGMEAHAVELGS
jgi:hypothetical protein